MSHGGEPEKAQLIEQLLETVRSRWTGPAADDVERFVGRYYRGVAAEDIVGRPLHDLYGAAVSHWRLLHEDSESPRIRVYNPEPGQFGWQSTHTIVEIVTDDMPFLVDSVSMALNKRGYTIHLIIHPVMPIRRDDAGRIRAVARNGDDHGHAACMHFEIDRQADAASLSAIADDLHQVLEDVRLAVQDWQPMRAHLLGVAQSLRQQPPACEQDLDEVTAFLEWLADEHFTLLGYRCYELVKVDGADALKAIPGSGLGILRKGRDISRSFAALPREIQRQARQPEPLIVTKSNSLATVHRPSYMDYVGIKRFDERGEVIGEHRFLGLYTSSAYNRSPRSIPLLRRKLDYVLSRADLPPRSHAGKALLNILETYPRDELFQIAPETLYDISLGILHLQERQRTRLFVRYDTYRRFVSCLVYAPRERYNTDVRHKMELILQKAFGGVQTEFAVQLSEAVLARIHFIVRLPEPATPPYDHGPLETLLAQTMRSWQDDYQTALLEHFGEATGARLFARYRCAFSAAYREDTSAQAAALDTERLEALTAERPMDIHLYRPLEAIDGVLRLKLYHRGRAITLSEILPVLENMGVKVIDELPYEVEPAQGERSWIHDFGLRYEGELAPDSEQTRTYFQQALAATWQGRAEDDGFNRLVLHAHLPWRDIVILRAYCKYLRQAGTTLSQAYIEGVLSDFPQISRRLVALFYARLDPDSRSDEDAARLAAEIAEALNAVPTLDEDRILRRYLAAIQATLRTNFFQRAGDGGPKPYLSFKLDAERIPDLPQPHPKYEIFVYAPYFEGVHLRGGKVARGGLRWSDRREDFRTEVLGLMKAQMVKNAVIVPVGAKGGFVPKRLPLGEREAVMTEVKRCYSDFIRGLLDLTDNRVDGEIAPPPQVVRHDDDDPYLVVAADKGTATFSDLANAIAAEYGFWLRDAFASGGSSGYDHKKMGITARGGWEAVKRHFRELGLDIQREDFTVAGIGDMSGDVFGNGMLLSRHIKLVAAFDHRHIFIDPQPDPAIAFEERRRLFQLPRSSWSDYDPAKLSEGGGVWARSVKSVTLSEPARRALGISQETLSPNELIRAILKAPVDLLWNGGIGTYVKASDETHLEVGDKAGDPVRVNANELRCRVVGEGGNLGFTQRGRIEYALRGGRINTDAIDNSGGVDSSDREVNIKILLNQAVDQGDLTLKQRDQLLAEMTDAVAALVLADNYQQTQSISLTEARAPELLDEHARFIRALEREGGLDRALEFLPSEEALSERAAAKRGLTRPELAVLLAYAKITAFRELLQDPVLDEPALARELLGYFPEPIQTRFPDAVRHHRLRREIAATVLTNQIVNRMGITFFYRMRQKTGASLGEIARAHLVAWKVYDQGAGWRQTDALDNQVPALVQTEMLLALADLQERAALWLLRNLPGPLAVEPVAERIAPAVERFCRSLPEVLPAALHAQLREESERLQSAAVPAPLAERVAARDLLFAVLDIAKICAGERDDLNAAASVYFLAAERLELNWLREAVDRYKAADPWQERLRAGLEDEVYLQLRHLTADVLAASEPAAEPAARVEAWLHRLGSRATRVQQLIAELRAMGRVELPMLAVAVQELKELVQAAGARSIGEGDGGAA